MHEVLVAWEQGALVPQDVKRILDAVRGKMCCLPIAAAAWLCAYMRTAPQETLLKPINMVCATDIFLLFVFCTLRNSFKGATTSQYSCF